MPSVPDARVAPALHGVWQSRGYGWVFEIGPDGALGYDVSAVGCVAGPSQTAEAFGSWARVFSRDGETVQIAARPEQVTRYTLDRIEQVPPSCGTPLGPTPTEVFAYAWQVMAEQYAFFDLYGVDWHARRAEVAPRIRDDMSDADLFEALVDLLDGLEDAHLALEAEVDGQRRRHRGKPAPVLGPLLRETFEAQSEATSMGGFANAWFNETHRRIREEILDPESVVIVGDEDAMWGRRGRIGYLQIGGMGGEALGDGLPPDARLAAVQEVLDRALTDLADTDALLLDVALNQGGSDAVGLAIAGHFANAPSPGLTKTAHGASTLAPQVVRVRPTTGVRYLKPVTLLTTDVTLSAAETFTLQMRALPTVTHVGEVTRGALSDVLFKSLPNGWTLQLSNEVYRDGDGVLWESRGITPDVPITVFTSGNLEGYPKALEGLLTWLSQTHRGG
ncbi:MAG: S41 family peptidase [Bacteroidota bacterium]